MTGGSSRGAPEFSVGAFGGELREISDALCDLGAELGAHLDKDLSGLADGAITALRRHACNVSIVGQVKSGKSSLLNALIRQPALLPTGPDPLTAVVTRVHFGTPDQPRQGARFSFFDPDEWDRLAHSGGRLRELAERLLPNFSQEALRTQLAEMRQRVSTELGPKFEELLGTAHDFPEISPDVLADNITAKGAGAQGAGNFAAITRTADLFFDNRGIGAPLTLVDTPGTNDPYLVREEITLRMIEDTEACIVVIPALDPVGISDLGLLRFLRGLHKERLIVFVNRIDELEQPARDIAEVNRRVRRVLSYEFPETHIPIIFGSARWAQLAMSGTPDALGDAELRRLLDYAAFLLEPDPGETSDWEKNAQAPHVRDRLLFHCSGVGELEVNLSWLMSRGSIGTYAHEVATTFATLAEGMMLTVQTELQAMQRNYDQELQQLQSRQDEVRKEADRLADVLARLEATQAGSLSELDRTEMKIRPELEARLRREIYAFARDQKEKLIELKRSGQLKGSSFHCETNPLRDRLADVFARNFRVTRQSIVNTQRLTAIRMRQLLSEALPDL
ncbi:MAG: dynamin family protein, partial [Pseudomonadota bacterium]